MKLHESSENYLETILILKNRLGQVRSIDIATELNFTKPSISRAMKLLRENNYITIDNFGYISLTSKGLDIAEKIYKRHIAISKLLISLGVEQNIALQDACKIEHVISEETFEKINNAVNLNVKDWLIWNMLLF